MAKQVKRVFLIIGVLVVAAGFVLVPSIAANAAAGGGSGSSLSGTGGANPAYSGTRPSGGAPQTDGARQDAPASAAAPAAKASGRAASTGATAVKTATAVKSDMQAYIEVNGNVVSKSQVAVAPDVGGRVSEVRAGLGDTVKTGELVAYVDPSKPGAVYELSPVYAPVSGVVVSVPVTAGSNIAAGATLLTLAAGNSLEIEALIPERSVGVLSAGLKAEVRLEAYPNETFSATVKKLSPVLDASSRTKKVVLEFDTADPRFNAGMFARLKLNTTRYPDVITVPVSAIVEKQGKTGVYVITGAENAAFREVTKGVSIDDLTEITSGLKSGEEVVVQGQQYLSDGAKVKVVA